jgi:hypothetical protein
MRRPPLRLVTAGSGGLGQSSAGTGTGCLNGWTMEATTGGGSRPGLAGVKAHKVPSIPLAVGEGQKTGLPAGPEYGRWRLAWALTLPRTKQSGGISR